MFAHQKQPPLLVYMLYMANAYTVLNSLTSLHVYTQIYVIYTLWCRVILCVFSCVYTKSYAFFLLQCMAWHWYINSNYHSTATTMSSEYVFDWAETMRANSLLGGLDGLLSNFHLFFFRDRTKPCPFIVLTVAASLIQSTTSDKYNVRHRFRAISVMHSHRRFCLCMWLD